MTETALSRVKSRIRERDPKSILRTPKKIRTSEIISRPVKETKNRNRTSGQITRDHLVALRNADSVEFEYLNHTHTRVTCFKDISQERDESDIISWDFKASSVLWTATDTELEEGTPVQAKYIARHTGFDWEYQTIIGALELNDDLEFIWFQDSHTTDQSEAVGIYVDSLKLIIYRGEYRFHFLLGIYAGNKDVRMIKVQKNG